MVCSNQSVRTAQGGTRVGVLAGALVAVGRCDIPDRVIITETNCRRMTTTTSCGHATTIRSLEGRDRALWSSVTITRPGCDIVELYASLPGKANQRVADDDKEGHDQQYPD